MAGQLEQDLRCPSSCGDIAAVKATVDGIAKRQDEHFTHLKDLMRKQDEHYEAVRKRIHEVVGDTNRSIGSNYVRLDTDINAVGQRVNTLDSKYSNLATEMSLLNHMVTENAQHSEERHKKIMEGLDYLKSRWWTVSMTALTGVGSIAGWLILDKLGWV